MSRTITVDAAHPIKTRSGTNRRGRRGSELIFDVCLLFSLFIVFACDCSGGGGGSGWVRLLTPLEALPIRPSISAEAKGFSYFLSVYYRFFVFLQCVGGGK